MTKKQKRILTLTDQVWKDNGWTAYAEIGDVVYGTRSGAQTGGNTMRNHGRVESAQCVVLEGGASLRTCVELRVVLRRPSAV
jgi:hypothetical protein